MLGIGVAVAPVVIYASLVGIVDLASKDVAKVTPTQSAIIVSPTTPSITAPAEETATRPAQLPAHLARLYA